MTIITPQRIIFWETSARETPVEPVIRRLDQAQHRIKNSVNWCRDAAALNKYDTKIPAFAAEAVKHCAIGAVVADNDKDDDPVSEMAMDALDKAARLIIETSGVCHDDDLCQPAVHKSVMHLNDCPQYGHPFVMQAYDLAKANLRAEAERQRSIVYVWHPAANWSAQIAALYAVTYHRAEPAA